MTREEAWRRTKGYLYDALSGEEADEIIKALEQEPCEEAISRQAVMDEIEFTPFDDYSDYLMIREKIEALPPVKPQEKIGHWILADEQNKEDVENDNYRFICSECKCSDIHAKGTIVPYCWYCGAKMIETQEKRCEDCDHYGKLSLDCGRCDDDCSMFEPKKSEEV